MKKLLSILFSMLLTINVIAQVSKTQNVTTPGTLNTLISAYSATVTSLTITGNIDARDFKTIQDNMPLLANLNLSAASIKTYTGTAGTDDGNNTVYPENEIPVYAFFNTTNYQGKTSLISVVMPSLTKAIGNYAFNLCTGLTSITIPSSVTSIGSGSFLNCVGLTSINVESGNQNYLSVSGVLFNKNQTEIILYPNSKVGSSYIIPKVTTIANSAFAYCSTLTSITIPSSVKSIGSSAFNYCEGLTSITIPSSVTSIGSEALINCFNLTSINVESGNQNYSSLNGVLFNKNQTEIIQYPNYKADNNYIIPNSVTTIGNYAFSNSSGLTSITIPASVTTIGNSAFSNCTGLTSINMNSKPPMINRSIFSRVNVRACILNVPYGTKELYMAETYWKSFTNIVEPASGFVLNTYNVKLSYNVESSTIDIFSNVNWTASSDQPWLTVSVESGSGNSSFILTAQANPSGILRTGTITISAAGLASQTLMVDQTGLTKSISVSAGNLAPALTTDQLNTISDLKILGTIDARDIKTLRDNMPVLAHLDLSEASIVAYTGTAGTSGTNSIVYPANEMPSNSFHNPINESGKTSLISVNMPLLTNTIGEAAFANCIGLTSINIPSSVTTIGDAAFTYCNGLTSISIPSSVTTIGRFAFDNCITLAGITIPSLVTTIGDYAFSNCAALTSISIPSTVTTIGNYAFSFCSGLTSIYASAAIPVDLTASSTVFNNVNKYTCTLYVPSGSKGLYQAANQWKDFTNMMEFTITALPTLSDATNVRIYPNPVIDKLSIEGLDANTRVSILDLNGRVMIEKNMSFDNSISLGSLLRGQYILQLGNQKLVKSFKIVKQ